MKRVMMAAALAAAGVMAAPAQAATVVHDAGGSRGTSIFQYGPVGQSFTMVGTSLTSFGFQFQTISTAQTNAALTFALLDGSTLGATVLRQVTGTPTAGAARQNFWYDFDLGGLSLTDGATYTAVVSATTDRLGLVYGPAANATADGYAGGQLLTTKPAFNANSNCTTGICDTNFRFASTGATSGAVPEPATWAMLLLGFGAVGYALRRGRGVRVTRQLV
ncbi:PEPxxWA-CTERM sorting domain-containing protein [Sphingomonas phyllosphaerae]|uniref:PEPxxWA-CTERM sorting domain-containing protein n=1 Tax=Sphingomonas phyllosphaerae TaxID=257003 RepID=UPI00048D69F1|nr:PEPxxWA-CTERM sorting domain-containing protein [Sphingomonas phyllosphaerae]